jgi:hypothetical protein
MTHHFSAESAAQVLRLVATGGAQLELLAPRRTMQQIAVGELSTAVSLPDGQRAVFHWFINSGEISHCVSAVLELPEQANQSASMQSWFAHGEDNPVALLDADDRQELDYALLHLT